MPVILCYNFIFRLVVFLTRDENCPLWFHTKALDVRLAAELEGCYPGEFDHISLPL